MRATGAWLWGAAVWLAAATPAAAAIVGYTGSAAFLAAVGGPSALTVEGFESLGVADAAIPSGVPVGGLTYTFPTGTQGRVDATYASFGAFGLGVSRAGGEGYFYNGEAVTIDLAAPVRAFGAYFNALEGAPGTFHATVGGERVGNGATYDTGSFYFVGLVSDDPFTRVVLGSESFSSGWTLDDPSFGTPVAVTPLPAGVAGLAVGLVALVGLRRRARARARA